MKVFLTGATGYVGSVVAEKLLQKGHHVLGLARNQNSEAQLRKKGIEPWRGDLTDLDSLKKGAGQAEAVIHTAFGHDFANFNKMVENERDALQTFTEVLKGTNRPFIATSAPAFLGDTGDALADEHFEVTQNSPFIARAAAENDILEATEKGVRAVVLRLPFYVYGRAGSTFLPVLIDAAKQNGAAYYVGDGSQKVSAVGVDDAAQLYVLALENQSAKGLYNVAAENVTNKQIAEAIARLVGVRAESLAPEIAPEKFGALVNFITINNQISAEKARREIGWQPNSQKSILEDIENGSYQALR